jgi:type VI secretion system protein ImpK
VPSSPASLPWPLLVQLTLSRAAQLARGGHFAQAEALLEGLPEGSSDPRVLDLRARMRAQEGRLAEAERLWLEAARLDPSSPGILAGLAEVRRRQMRGRHPDLLPAAVLPWVLAGLLGAALWLTPRGIAPPPAVAPAAAPQPPKALDEDLSPGADLFDGGAGLTPRGRAILASLGEDLDRRSGPFQVELEGRSDATPIPPGRRFASNEELAMARAEAAFRALHRGSRLKASAFRLSAAVLPAGAPGARSVSLRLRKGSGP